MDEHNVHHFWGISPALDLGSLLPNSPDGAAALPVDQPIRILQVAPYDARHTITTICRAARHPLLQKQQQPVHLVVWEDCPEGLARHLLLLAVLLDGGVLPRERMELLLELHGNAVVRERAASYLDEKARQLEALVVALASGGARGGAATSGPDTAGASDETRGVAALERMLDLSLLKFQEKDLLVEALQKWRTTVPYDMVKAWDARARKWYGDRYDFRRNMVDWDYHMRLQVAGTPGQDPAHGSIIHFHHFRHWRMHGVAHELRDSHYNHSNRSLLSTAYGRTREFKDRTGRDVGRSVSAWGFWADALNGPYHCFGTLTDEPSFYQVTNKQFARTAVDVAEHNITALLHELRTGQPLVLGEGCEAPRAKVARGPTTIEDLTAASQQQQAGQGEEGEQQQQAGPQEEEGRRTGQPEATAQRSTPEEEETADAGAVCLGPGQVAGAQGKAAEAGAVPETGSEACDGASTAEEPPGVSASSPAVDSAPPPKYKSGGRAAVTQAVAAAASAARPVADSSPYDRAETAGCQEPKAQTNDEAARAAAGAGAPGPGADETAKQQMAAEEAALRAAEEALDAAARTRLDGRFRLQLATGDLAKAVTGRAKFAGCFSVLTLGHRHVHMLGEEYGLMRAAAPGAVLVAENARHVLQLNKEQTALFVTKMDEMAAAVGWRKAPARPPGVTEACEVYGKPAAA